MKMIKFVILFFIATNTNAKMFKCEDPDGNIKYQQTQCESETGQTVIKERGKSKPLPEISFEKATDGFAEFAEVYADKTSDCKIELKVYEAPKDGCLGHLRMAPEYQQRINSIIADKDQMNIWLAKEGRNAKEIVKNMEKANSNVRYIKSYLGIR